MIDVPVGIFENVDDQRVNLPEFARQYRLAQLPTSTSNQPSTTNMLQFLVTPSAEDVALPTNLFVKFARRQRSALTDYDRNLFCILDADKEARLGFTHISSFVQEGF